MEKLYTMASGSVRKKHDCSKIEGRLEHASGMDYGNAYQNKGSREYCASDDLPEVVSDILPAIRDGVQGTRWK